MSGEAGEILARLLHAAFVICDPALVGELLDPGARVRDAHLAEATPAAFLELVGTYAHALVERDLTVSVLVGDDRQALAHFRVLGVHVGVALGVVPVGRHVTLDASATLRLEGARVVELENAWACGALLRSFGLHDDAASAFQIYATKVGAPQACELLSGSPERTRWARAWSLSPFLARTAVLVMAGLDARAMSAALGVTTATVRTYVRELYAVTGVHGRLPLLRAAHALADRPAHGMTS